MSDMKQNIAWDDFEKVDIRVGEIIDVQDFPEARKSAYKLLISFGDSIGEKRSSAQITHLNKADLVGTQVAAVVNFPPKQIGPFISECLTLGFSNGEGGWTVVSPIKSVPLGGRLQ